MEKRNPVRRDPERRRQQNLQAQKRYRARLRERLNHLERLAASSTQTRAIEGIPDTATSPFDVVTMNGSPSTPSRIIAPTLSAYVVLKDDFFGSSEAKQRLSLPQRHISRRNHTLLASTTWDAKTHLDSSLLIRDRHNHSIGPHWTITIDCGCSSPHVQLRTQGPEPSNYGEVKIINFESNVITANPYVNNLRIEIVCIAAALYDIGLHVGITEEMLCAEQSLSSFFRSSAQSADDVAKEKTICTVEGLYKTLKPDLRPTREQITVSHHPYIDILPFPTLRRNLINHQEEIDEDEFFHDMLSGLVCWGGSGIGRKDRDESTGYASTGTPWDFRSWEGRLWFLKKYWTLLGGEDGELARQSEWWRSMRGDDIPNKEDLE